jgi:hypothetical protein
MVQANAVAVLIHFYCDAYPVVRGFNIREGRRISPPNSRNWAQLLTELLVSCSTTAYDDAIASDVVDTQPSSSLSFLSSSSSSTTSSSSSAASVAKNLGQANVLKKPRKVLLPLRPGDGDLIWAGILVLPQNINNFNNQSNNHSSNPGNSSGVSGSGSGSKNGNFETTGLIASMLYEPKLIGYSINIMLHHAFENVPLSEVLFAHFMGQIKKELTKAFPFDFKNQLLVIQSLLLISDSKQQQRINVMMPLIAQVITSSLQKKADIDAANANKSYNGYGNNSGQKDNLETRFLLVILRMLIQLAAREDKISAWVDKYLGKQLSKWVLIVGNGA